MSGMLRLSFFPCRGKLDAFLGSVLLRRMDKLVISEATASALALAAASASTLLRGERQRLSGPPLAFSELPALFLFLLARR